MAQIKPPLEKGKRRQETQTIKMYKSTVTILDALVKSENTSRVEYLRWLVDCAEAGLVGLAPGVDLVQERLNFITALIDGQMTYSEAGEALERLMFRACQEQRAHSESEWSGRNDES